ncbi:MAG TPA: hypothetical protein PK367_01200 [Candidatus Paceibacterota bacterium]|nr:hypothetical protein [Candidatus Paceibacterota bacterium]
MKKHDDNLVISVVFGIMIGIFAIIVGTSALFDGINKNAIDPPLTIMFGEIALFIGLVFVVGSMVGFFRWLKK